MIVMLTSWLVLVWKAIRHSGEKDPESSGPDGNTGLLVSRTQYGDQITYLIRKIHLQLVPGLPLMAPPMIGPNSMERGIPMVSCAVAEASFSGGTNSVRRTVLRE